MQCSRPTMKVWCETFKTLFGSFNIHIFLSMRYFSFEIFARVGFFLLLFHFLVLDSFYFAVVVVTMLFSVWLFSKNFFLRYFFFLCLRIYLLLRSYLHNAHKGDSDADGHEKAKKKTNQIRNILFLSLSHSHFSFQLLSHSSKSDRVSVFFEIFALCHFEQWNSILRRKYGFKIQSKINAYVEI